MITIDGYPIDLALTENHSMDSDVSEYPVEKGADVTDFIRARPIEITLEGVVSDTPIGAIARDSTRASGKPSQNTYRRLVDIRNAKEPVTIVTGLGRFETMAMTRLSIPRSSKNSKGLQFTVTFRQITLVTNNRTTVKTATPGSGKSKDFGLNLDKTVPGNHILWRKGDPPGLGPFTVPQGQIVGLEFVTIQKDGAKLRYFHENGKLMLGDEIEAFQKDRFRDVSAQPPHVGKRSLIEPKTSNPQRDIEAAEDLRQFKKTHPGQKVSPSLFGL